MSDRPQARGATFSKSYTRTALILLMLVYTSGYIDRTILLSLAQPIKQDLKISDTQLGLLLGIGFALFYTILSIPVSRLAERFSRVNILTICLLIWSVMTALSGFAANFLQLLLFRLGVGVGEAGCSPTAHSIIADLYPAEKRTSALSVYAFGLPLGVMIGAVSGGWIADHLSWRIAFFLVGVPGALLALVARLLLREPPRGMSEPAGRATHTEPVPALASVVRKLCRNRSFIHIAIGATLVTFMLIGAGAFAQPYFVRAFHLSYTQIGLVFGIVNGLSAGLGTLLGGFATEWAARHDRRWYAWVPGIGVLISAPLFMAAYLAPNWIWAAVALLLPGAFAYTYLAPTFSVMHNLIAPRMRASATALLFLVMNLVGQGGGPYFTGWVSDHMARRLFDIHHLGHFATACPGGVAAAHAAHALEQACMSSSAMGTRTAIVVTYGFGFWAAAHYFLAARRLRQDMARAEAETTGAAAQPA